MVTPLTLIERGQRAKLEAERRAQVEQVAAAKRREYGTTLRPFLPK